RRARARRPGLQASPPRARRAPRRTAPRSAARARRPDRRRRRRPPRRFGFGRSFHVSVVSSFARLVLDWAAGRLSQPPARVVCPTLPRELPLPSAELGPAAPSRREGGVAPRRAVPARWLHLAGRGRSALHAAASRASGRHLGN